MWSEVGKRDAEKSGRMKASIFHNLRTPATYAWKFLKKELYERPNRDVGGVDCEEGTRVAEPINTLERKAPLNAVMKLSTISTTCS